MSQSLQNKFAVLYVLENDVKSHRAVSIAQALPEIYIQYVGLLSAEQVPSWLTEVPTCVTLSDRKIHTGTEALELLTMVWNARQQQQHQQVQQQQVQQQQQQHQQQQQQYYPQQQRGERSIPVNSNVSGRPLSSTLPQVAQSGRMPQQPQQPPPPQLSQSDPGSGFIKTSIQPASGTGQYGCSLDAAFAPSEEEQQQQQPSAIHQDNQFSGGKVNQRDIDSYIRLREKSGQVQKQLQQ
jgi:hypothetical protein